MSYSTATLSTLFQIGVDNALIQVPQYYTVPANPPSMPNPPTNPAAPVNTVTTTTKDSVTIYVSAIQGFNKELTLSFYVQKIDLNLDPTMTPSDATNAPWQGKIGWDSSHWGTGTFTTYSPTDKGWVGNISKTLWPNKTNSLDTSVVAYNYRTLWINPEGTGGVIDPNYPPSYLVTIYARESVSNTYAACSFTLVVLPSVAGYGLGIYERTLSNPNIAYDPFFPKENPLVFSNAVELLPNGFALAPNKSLAVLYFNFYPLEPLQATLNPINVTFDIFNSQIIDQAKSTIYGPSPGGPVTEFLNAYAGDIQIPSGIQRNPPSITDAVIVTLYLLGGNVTVNGASYPIGQTSSVPVLAHTLFQLQGTDTLGVTATAYTVITVGS